MTAYAYQFIEDLPSDWQRFASADLKNLAPIWRERKQKIGETAPELQKFNDRLRREWAIETGIIENLYSIDVGTTQTLIEHGLVASLMPYGATNKPPEQIVLVLQDQEKALELVFQFIKDKRRLSTAYIKELHSVLTMHQEYVEGIDSLGRKVRSPLMLGQWKRQPNSPIRRDGLVHEYCPPVHVDAEMDNLIALHLAHTADEVPPEVEAAWLHHRFAQIHPFQDGNGRVARALASLAFLRAGWFPLVIHREIREEYITALEAADAENLAPLITLFTKQQKDAFIKALSIAGDVIKEHETRHQIIAAARERLRDRRETRVQNYRHAFVLSDRLEKMTESVLEDVAVEINAELKSFETRYFATASRSTEGDSHYYRRQIELVARHFEYFADTRSYGAWTRLKIREDRQTDLIFSFHSLGVEFSGILAVSAFLQFKDDEEERIDVEAPETICAEIFQFYYNETEDAVAERFQGWLNRSILVGLDQWRRQL